MQLKRLALVAALSVLSAASVASVASAQTFDTTHPRQAQVLDRVHSQRQEIRREVHRGEISHVRAHRLLVRENRIAREDRMMSRAHGGRITRREQHDLNRQETRTHREIPS